KCFNPETHSVTGGEFFSVPSVFTALTQPEGLKGVTISGGEPFQQPVQVLELCALIQATTPLSIICFTGFTLPELETKPWWEPRNIDVLIAGRYDRSRRVARELAGSA